MAEVILKTSRSIPVDSFGGEKDLFFLPPGEYRPTVCTIGDDNTDWWLVSADCCNYSLGLPAQEWKFLAGQGFLTIQKKEDGRDVQ